jgi:hypothetical protein
LKLGQCLWHPGGMPAISRWLSEATPPETDVMYFHRPGRGRSVPRHAHALRPLPGSLSPTNLRVPGVSLRSTPG